MIYLQFFTTKTIHGNDDYPSHEKRQCWRKADSVKEAIQAAADFGAESVRICDSERKNCITLSLEILGTGSGQTAYQVCGLVATTAA